MNYISVQGLDKRVSRLVQGTTMITGANPADDFAVLDAFVAQGGTTFDTARHYGAGANELAFGHWLKARGNRDDVVVIGKGAHPVGSEPRVDPQSITDDLHETLGALGTDHVDIYLLHRDDPSVPVGPIVEVLNEHHAAGRIGVFGGSNWTTERIKQANAYADQHALVRFGASSPHFSLAQQFSPPWEGCVSITGPQNAAAREFYLDSRMPVFAWSSMAGGFFTGRFRRDNLATFEDEDDLTTVAAYCREENFRRLDRATALAAELQLSAPQVALAYVLGQPMNIAALAGSRTPAEVEQNAAAERLELSAEDLEWLEG